MMIIYLYLLWVGCSTCNKVWIWTHHWSINELIKVLWWWVW